MIEPFSNSSCFQMQKVFWGENFFSCSIGLILSNFFVHTPITCSVLIEQEFPLYLKATSELGEHKKLCSHKKKRLFGHIFIGSHLAKPSKHPKKGKMGEKTDGSSDIQKKHKWYGAMREGQGYPPGSLKSFSPAS